MLGSQLHIVGAKTTIDIQLLLPVLVLLCPAILLPTLPP